jgi:hypothetical protein
MSYLEMAASPLPDMKQGIISLWFRDITLGTAPPAEPWPAGVWTPGTNSMVPPDTNAIVNTLVPPALFYWNAYGSPLAQFGGALTGPASVFMATPPPFATDTMHMLLTFGNPNQSYNYGEWQLEYPSVIEAVEYLGSPFVVSSQPPPYKIYNHYIGDDGKFKVANMRIASKVSKPNMVPQSFIGVDADGYLIICLQTDTNATYKGCAFQIDEITELKAGGTQLIIDGPPYTYTQIGFPYPDGHWIQQDGYWNGYQFKYKDISNDVMGAQPETFIIGGPGVFLDVVPGPRVSGAGWHHVLFSFDISGAVTATQPDDPVSGKPTATTQCKAWLAVDDHNYTGMALQKRLRLPDGLIRPLLPGMGHDLLPFGPSTSYGRPDFTPELKPNDILPQNVWIHGFSGNPKKGLPRCASNAPILTEASDFAPAGDFDPLYWAGAEWPLYGNGVAPGPWLPILDPPHPTVADPAGFDLPSYQCDSFNIPVFGYPIGIPVATRHLTHNTGVEMGELQIWANKTLDTSNINARRLFIDDVGKPVPPGVAARTLGRPDVLLHGTSDWKEGVNSGQAGLDADNNIIRTGQFKPIAKIERFLPDPELGK